MSVLYTTRLGRTPSDSISSSIARDSSHIPLMPVARIIAAYVYSSGLSPAHQTRHDTQQKKTELVDKKIYA